MDVLVSVVLIALVCEPKACDLANKWPWDIPDSTEEDWIDDERVA
jgi:hypothetical protein